MIELVIVLVIMAIVGTFVVSRTARTGADLVAQAEILKSHLRYAQIKAMSDTEPWGIHIPNASSYVLYRNNLQAAAQLPGETGQTRTLPAPVTITAGAGVTYNFNDWGKPVDVAKNALTVNQTITLSDGTATNSVTITKNTGYIP